MHRMALDDTYWGNDIDMAQTPPRSQSGLCPPTPRRGGITNPPFGGKERLHNSRRAAMLYCPFTGCPNMQLAQSADTLTKHLSRVHLAAGQPIPTELLASLKQAVCAPCSQLYPMTGTCLGCGAAVADTRSEPVPMDVDSPSSSTRVVHPANQVPEVAAPDPIPPGGRAGWSSLDGMEPPALTPSIGGSPPIPSPDGAPHT